MYYKIIISWNRNEAKIKSQYKISTTSSTILQSKATSADSCEPNEIVKLKALFSYANRTFEETFRNEQSRKQYEFRSAINCLSLKQWVDG